MYGSVVGRIMRPGAWSPRAKPWTTWVYGSLIVIQCFTRSPKRSKQTRAYATKAFAVWCDSQPSCSSCSGSGRSQWYSVATGWMPFLRSSSISAE